MSNQAEFNVCSFDLSREATTGSIISESMLRAEVLKRLPEPPEGKRWDIQCVAVEFETYYTLKYTATLVDTTPVFDD